MRAHPAVPQSRSLAVSQSRSPARVRRHNALNNDNLVLIAAICLRSGVADCVADGQILHALNILVTLLTAILRIFK